MVQQAISGRLHWAILVIILAAYCALAVGYNLRIPIYETYDEPAHLLYIEHLRRTHRLPEIGPTVPPLVRLNTEQEMHNPPLYYVSAALALEIAGAPSVRPELTLKPLEVHGPGDRLFFEHGDGEDFPYSSSVRWLHIVRFLSTLYGVGTLVLVFFTVRTLFTADRWLAPAATASIAFLPQFTYMTATVNNDAAAFFFGAAILFSIAKLLTSKGDPRWGLLAGIALGLGLLSKATVWPLVPLPFLAAMLAPTDMRSRVRLLALVATGVLATSGWYFLRNLVVYSDPLALNAQKAYLAWHEVPHSLTDPWFREFFPLWLRRSFWFMGGWFEASLPGYLYDVLDFAAAVTVAGLLALAVNRRLRASLGHAVGWFLLLGSLGVALLLAATVRLSLTYPTPHGRYFLIMGPFIGLSLVLGLTTLFTLQARRGAAVALFWPAFLLLVNLYTLLEVVPEFYGPW